MIKNILLIIIPILLIIGIILIIRYAINNSEKDYKGANIISFFFPIVGLIIYAVNIGKNDKLAKSSVKSALSGLFTSVLLFFLIQVLLYFLYTSKTEHTASNTSSIKETTNNKEEYDDINILKKELLNNEYITSCEIKLTGKIYYINIEYKSNDIYDEKTYINNIIKKYNLDRQYDYIININSKYIGNYSGIKNDNIIWAQSK